MVNNLYFCLTNFIWKEKGGSKKNCFYSQQFLVSICEIFKTSNIFAVVGAGDISMWSLRKLSIFDSKQSKVLVEFEKNSKILKVVFIDKKFLLLMV